MTNEQAPQDAESPLIAPSALNAGLEIWVCFFADGTPIISTFAGSQKGSIRKARAMFAVEKWKELKYRGIRCNEVLVSPKRSKDDRIKFIRGQIMSGGFSKT